MADSGYEDCSDDYNYPRTLRDLLKHSINIDSPYHYLGLLTINSFIWNLDIYVYLLNSFQFQVRFRSIKLLFSRFASAV